MRRQTRMLSVGMKSNWSRQFIKTCRQVVRTPSRDSESCREVREVLEQIQMLSVGMQSNWSRKFIETYRQAERLPSRHNSFRSLDRSRGFIEVLDELHGGVR